MPSTSLAERIDYVHFIQKQHLNSGKTEHAARRRRAAHFQVVQTVQVGERTRITAADYATLRISMTQASDHNQAQFARHRFKASRIAIKVTRGAAPT